MGRGDTINGSEELDNLLLYLELQLSHVQILNIKGKLTSSDIESLHVSLTLIKFIPLITHDISLNTFANKKANTTVSTPEQHL